MFASVQLATARPTRAPVRIVVVDDSIDFLELMEEILAEAGYEVITCDQGADAHLLIKRLKPGLLILDVRMVGVDEWAVLDSVKGDPETAGIPVIVCSAAAREIRAAEARLRDQDCDVVFKPFEIDDLLAKVRDHVGDGQVAR